MHSLELLTLTPNPSNIGVERRANETQQIDRPGVGSAVTLCVSEPMVTMRPVAC
jgi:hypothetical protein